MNTNTEHLDWKYVVSDWTRWDLAALGTVDKVVFYLESTEVNSPVWFCLDGIQLKNK